MTGFVALWNIDLTRNRLNNDTEQLAHSLVFRAGQPGPEASILMSQANLTR